ncbi:CsbD family protein [Mycolicibacterium sp. CH28]|uniref:CsbD family protein n=1 Tax=Mycolicibacterium sp. CH28 TaxID=2512237 RepID=UPI001080250F|nr:CsbD family protein [Mycolicibacterium sp. CH28]TGD84974.1 CsbD family protein [Mycolicibacterium sp. CH28]
MSDIDKAKNKIQDVGGQAKEALGKVTGDQSAEREGQRDQAKSHLKDAGEKVKEAGEKLKEAGEKVFDVFHKK